MVIPDELIKEVMQEVIDKFLKPRFIELGMNASGSWLAALEARVNNGVGEIWGRDYTYWLNNGRGPNHDQSTEAINRWAAWYGPNVMKPWAQSKGLVFDNYFLLARSIALNGTKKRPERRNFVDLLEGKEVKDYIYSRIRIGVTAQVNKDLNIKIREIFR